MARHILTLEERRRGGQNGFRAAVLKVQVEHGLEFNEAVQWLLRRISPNGDWKSARERRNGNGNKS